LKRSIEILETYKKQAEIAETEFNNIVLETKISFLPSGEPLKLRLFIIDNTFVDIYLSVSGKYSYHWDRRLVGELIYRHDNLPHQRWSRVKTAPKHFHNGGEC